jgi:hypothetical protein
LALKQEKEAAAAEEYEMDGVDPTLLQEQVEKAVELIQKVSQAFPRSMVRRA